jgi:hypothetical protein
MIVASRGTSFQGWSLTGMTDRFLALIVASILLLVTACTVATTPGKPGVLVDDAGTLALRKSRLDVNASWRSARQEQRQERSQEQREERYPRLVRE